MPPMCRTRRRRVGDGDPVRQLSVPDEALRRRRISGARLPTCGEGDHGGLECEIVKRSDQTKGFLLLPKRWIVERTFAWLGRCRRLAKDWECLNRKSLAFLRLASIRLMLRKLCNLIMFSDGL